MGKHAKKQDLKTVAWAVMSNEDQIRQLWERIDPGHEMEVSEEFSKAYLSKKHNREWVEEWRKVEEAQGQEEADPDFSDLLADGTIPDITADIISPDSREINRIDYVSMHMMARLAGLLARKKPELLKDLDAYKEQLEVMASVVSIEMEKAFKEELTRLGA